MGPLYQPQVSYAAHGFSPADMPGPARGVLDMLRREGNPWAGPQSAGQKTADEALTTERIRSGPANVILPWLLPYDFHGGEETPAMRLAYRRMMADPNVKAAVLGVIYGVAALDLQITPVDKKNATDRRVADFVRWNLTRRLHEGLSALVEGVLLHALIDGYSVNAKVWGRQDKGEHAGRYVLRQLKPVDVGNDAALQTDAYRNVVGVMGLRFNPGMEFHPSQFVIYRHLPLYNQPTGTSAFRAVYGRWWALDTVTKLRVVAADKRSIPFLLGYYQSPAQQAGLENALSKVKAQQWASIPEGTKVELLNMAGEADHIFKAFTDDLREEIFLGIQLATLQALTGGQGEQRGSSKVHKSTSDLGRWRLAKAIEDVLNDPEQGLIKDIVDLNEVVADYPHATLSAVDVDEMKAEADLDKVLVDMGLEQSKEAAYERYGREPPTGPGDVLAPKPPPGQGPLGGLGLPPPSPDTGPGLPPDQPPEQEQPPDLDRFIDDDDDHVDVVDAPGQSEGFAEPPKHQIGEKWQGPSGMWFTLNQQGHVTPTTAPYQAGAALSGAAAPVKAQASKRTNSRLPDDSRPQLDPAEVIAARSYVNTAYESLNQGLRSGKPLEETVDATHRALQSAMEKTRPFPQPVKVWRGMRLPPDKTEVLIRKLQAAQAPGKAIRLGGYTSTTTSKDVARDFGASILFHIEAHKGLDMAPYGSATEKELLLDHNSAFQVVGVEKKGGKLHVKLKQLLPPQKHADRPRLFSEDGEEYPWENFVETFADWEPYTGPRGGKGIRNTKTGRVLYGVTEAPGERKKAEPKPAMKRPPMKSAPAPRAQRPTADDLHAHIQELRKGTITHEHLQGVASKLASMTVKDITALKTKLGVKASGVKAELVRKITERALGQATKPAAKPAPTSPSPQGGDKEKGGGTKKVAKVDGKPTGQPEKPAAPAQPSNHAATIAQHWDSLPGAKSNLVSLADLKDATGMSTADLHAAVQKLRRDGILTGSAPEGRHGLSKREQEAAMPDGDQRILYVSVRQGQEGALKALGGKHG